MKILTILFITLILSGCATIFGIPGSKKGPETVEDIQDAPTAPSIYVQDARRKIKEMCNSPKNYSSVWCDCINRPTTTPDCPGYRGK